MANWFIGLPIPSDPWFQTLPEPPSNVRPFAAEDLHASVAFLGRVEAEQASAAFELAQNWPTGPIPATLEDVRPMGNPRRASALTAMIQAEPGLLEDAIGSVRNAMLAAAGAPPDQRPPLAHVTLARIGRKASKQERKNAISWAEGLDLGRPVVTIDRLALYTWAQDRKRQLFEIVESVGLVEPGDDLGDQSSPTPCS